MKILIIATGGTISHDVNQEGICVSKGRAITGNTFAKILSAATRTLDERVKISSQGILNKDSANMTMGDWRLIISAIVKNYDAYDAFIVTHGTETMGYATAAVSFGLPNLGKPVVFTGAQVPYGQIGSDAVMNLENTLRFIVGTKEAKGVFLVFGSHIITGTRVKKRSEFAYDTFKLNPIFTIIGIVGQDIEIKQHHLKTHLSYLKPYAKNASELIIADHFSNDIAVLSEFPGMQADIIINLAKAGIRGFILRSYGSGVPNIGNEAEEFENLRPAFEYLHSKKIPIAIISQAPNGRACMSIYEPSFFARELGAIPTHDIGIEAAVAKMAWLVGANKNYEEICSLMQNPLKGEMK